MKLLHISDLHIGKRVNGMSMVEDQRFVLHQIVSILREERVDAVLVAGDIYDKASPSAEAVTVFDAFISEVVSLGVRVIAIPGNHDSAERIAYAQGLLSSQGVLFPPVFDGKLEHVVLEDGVGEVVVWLLPFVKPGDVRRHFPELEIGDDYTAAVKAVLGTCEVDVSKRNVIVAHQLVTAGGDAPDRADDEIQLGGVDNVDVSVFDAFDYVALGHVHRPQRIGRDTARYSGSPLKYSFSEARYEKSAVLVELGAKQPGDEVGGCVAWRTVPLKPKHDMREVRATLAELLEAGAGGGEETADYLHVTLTDEHPQLDAMAKIHEVFPNAMALDYDGTAALVARHVSKAAIDPERVDTVDLFAQFYEEQTETPLDDVQRDLVAKAVRAVEERCARGDDDEKGGAR